MFDFPIDDDLELLSKMATTAMFSIMNTKHEKMACRYPELHINPSQIIRRTDAAVRIVGRKA